MIDADIPIGTRDDAGVTRYIFKDPWHMAALCSASEMECRVMAHRYLYYVTAEAYLPDHLYDSLERAARHVCPPESPVHKLGSSLASSYTPEHIAFAEGLVASLRNKRSGGQHKKQEVG